MQFRSSIILGGLLVGIVLSRFVNAQETPPAIETRPTVQEAFAAILKQSETDAELGTIRKSSLAFVEAFNAADAKALAAHWNDDGDYIDESGQTYTGRKAIEREYAKFFAEHPGHKLKLTIDSLKLLSPTAAIEDGRVALDPSPPGPPAIAKYTAVHVKENGQWLMSTVRDTRVESPSSFAKLQPLDWLVGSWSAEEHDVKSASDCRWIANKSYLQRTYSVTSKDQVTSSGMQIIGWNPRAQQIQSWTFSSDGGMAVGNWIGNEMGWVIELQGTQADGTPTSAINLLVPLDANGFSWQSVARHVGDISLPDTEEIVLKRQAEGK